MGPRYPFLRDPRFVAILLRAEALRDFAVRFLGLALRGFVDRFRLTVAEIFFLLGDSGLIDSGLAAECDCGGVGSVVSICVMFTSVPAAFPNVRAAAINKGSCAFIFRAIDPPIATFLT